MQEEPWEKKEIEQVLSILTFDQLKNFYAQAKKSYTT